MLVYMDLETFSDANLSKMGAFKYAESPKTEILLWGYAIGDEPAKVWDLTADPMPPADLMQAIENIQCGDWKCVWHNGFMFDVPVIEKVMGVRFPIGNIIDTMVIAFQHALPGKLADLSAIFKLPEDKAKDKEGPRLVNLFCKPLPVGRKLSRATSATHPEEWKRFINYCRLDVEAERELYRKLPKWNCTREEHELQKLDAEINRRGIGIDLELAQAAMQCAQEHQARVDGKVHKLTDGAVSSSRQTAALIEAMEKTYGFRLDSLQKSEVARWAEREDIPEPMREILRLRLSGAKSSVLKYNTVVQAACKDGRLHGTLQFRGASRTGRFSGRLFQPQNLARPTMKNAEIETAIDLVKCGLASSFYDDPAEVLANCLRGLIIPGKGFRFCVADFSSIEGRVLAWLAGEKWKLDAYREYDVLLAKDGSHIALHERAARHNDILLDEKGEPVHVGHDMYKLTYARSFNVPPESVNKEQRQMGKVLELAMGYGGGAGAFATFARGYNVDLHKIAESLDVPAQVREEALKAWEWALEKKVTAGLEKDVWVACDSIKRMWRAANPKIVQFWSDLEDAFRRCALVQADHCTANDKVRFTRIRNWIACFLPSTRTLCYPAPKVDESGHLTYMGVDQVTRKWCRLETYGGKLAENVTQAVAADILTQAMLNAWFKGYKTVMTVHDEMITEVPVESDLSHWGLEHVMCCEQPQWTDGLPLAAEGYDALRYRK